MNDCISNLVYNTIRIESFCGDEYLACATSFLIALTYGEILYDTNNEGYCPAGIYLVVNKHSIDKATKIRFVFPGTNKWGGRITPNSEREHICILDEHMVTRHPDENIDLALINITEIAFGYSNCAPSEGYSYLNFLDCIPDYDEWGKFSAAEEVYMIGYPNGLWDEKNCLPIIRKGIAASLLSYDFNGNPEFLIDAGCFPGSSGSPVFNLFTDSCGNERYYLLGILRAGDTYLADGAVFNPEELKEKKTLNFAKVQSSLNLGYVIKSSALIDILPLARKKMI